MTRTSSRRVLLLQNFRLTSGEQTEEEVVVDGMHLGKQCWNPARRYECNQILEDRYCGKLLMDNVSRTLGSMVGVQKAWVKND